MGKTTKPLKILVVSDAKSNLMENEHVKALIEKGDTVVGVPITALPEAFQFDVIMGPSCLRTAEDIMPMTVKVIELVRKEKPKPPPKTKKKPAKKKEETSEEGLTVEKIKAVKATLDAHTHVPSLSAKMQAYVDSHDAPSPEET